MIILKFCCTFALPSTNPIWPGRSVSTSSFASRRMLFLRSSASPPGKSERPTFWLKTTSPGKRTLRYRRVEGDGTGRVPRDEVDLENFISQGDLAFRKDQIDIDFRKRKTEPFIHLRADLGQEIEFLPVKPDARV